MSTKPLLTGDKVRIECEGRKTVGHVLLASGNGKSLALEFDDIIDGHVCVLPVLMEDDGKYYSLVTGHLVRVQLVV